MRAPLIVAHKQVLIVALLCAFLRSSVAEPAAAAQAAAEVGLIGYEGMVGLPVLLGAEHDDIEGMVQMPGSALRMDAQAFREDLECSATIRTCLCATIRGARTERYDNAYGCIRL